MRTCIHCSLQGEDLLFATYKDQKKNLRYRNVCRECFKRHARGRQAAYKERHPDRVRKSQRAQKYLRYWNDPDFREKCKEYARKKNTL